MKIKNIDFNKFDGLWIETHDVDERIYINECKDMAAFIEEYKQIEDDNAILLNREHYVVVDFDDGLTHYWLDKSMKDLDAIKNIIMLAQSKQGYTLEEIEEMFDEAWKSQLEAHL